jgi:hypothetical protein
MIIQGGNSASGSRMGGWSALARWAGFAALGVFGLLIVLAAAVATAAVAVIGLIVTAAMLVLRIGAPKPDMSGDLVLEGRRTPEGWVVEATPRGR